MDVDRLLSDAAGKVDLRHRMRAEMGSARDAGMAAVRFIKAAGAIMRDADAVDGSQWEGSRDEELVARCLHDAEYALVMATVTLHEWHHKHRSRCAYCGDRMEAAGKWCGACNPQAEGFA